MTPPLFKAWHKKQQQLFDVTSIDFTNDVIQLATNGSIIQPIPLSDVELWPYTRLKDRNDTPIYENEVYRYRIIVDFKTKQFVYGYGVVNWDSTIIENDPFANEEPVDEAYYTGYSIDPQTIEVVGNKYDHHDLLVQR